MPSSNATFWQEKFKRNIERDRENEQLLNDLGWRLIIVWECELNNRNKLDEIVVQIRGEATTMKP